MSFLRCLPFALLLGFCLSVSPSYAEPPSRDAVQQSLDGLAQRKLAEADQAAVQQALERTLSLLDQRATTQQALASLKQQLAEAPRLIATSQHQLAQLKASTPVDIARRYAASKVPEIEQLIAERSNQLNEWQKASTAANSLIITSQTRPERAQTEISSNQTRSQEISSALKTGKLDGKPLIPESRGMLEAELAQLDVQTQLRRQEMAGNSLLQDLGNAQRDLLQERIARLEKEILDLQQLISDKRREQSEQTVAAQSAEAQKLSPDSLLAQESSENLQLSDYLLKATDRLSELNRLNLEARQKLDNLTQADQALEEQINVLKGSLLLSKILYQQQQALPKVKTDSNLADEIADLRLYQFELSQRREKLGRPSEYVDRLLAAQPPEQVTPELRQSLQGIADTRAELLAQLNTELNSLLSESINLQLNQKQLQDTAKSLRATLEEQMFWIPSNQPLGLDWLRLAPSYLESQVARVPWSSLTQELLAGLGSRPWVFIPLLLGIGVLLWRRRFIHQKLQKLHGDIGHYKNDSQLHTPLAVFLYILLALPGSLFLMLCGLALRYDARGQNAALGSALIQMAEAWLVFYTAYRVLDSGGLAELHFRWARRQVSFLRAQMRKLGFVVMALLAVVSIAEVQPETLAEDVIGIVVVLVCYALMAWLLGKTLLSGPRKKAVNLIIGVAIIALPIALILAVGFGYYYTALRLSDRLIDTLYLVMIWILLEAMSVRWLSVAARRLAYQRAFAKRQTQVKEGPEGQELQEEPNLDIEQINQQSLRLIRLALLGLFLVALYWVWADLIGVFAYLDNVTLYTYTSGTGATATQTPISLLNLLSALLIVAVTLALARNLPGLLEVLVLSRLSLAQGSAYAMTTLLSYVITGAGLVVGLSTLGVSWDKLQWLVAALSVGLGFGMQEIFANFISGLIILFERPVRIGDLVTVGGVTGSVNRIQIRATHITDADKKVVIVPNKTFVTSQLINWTLTDTVTRLVLKVGVGYGSDLELVRRLLYQAADENARVMRDPEPLVLFQVFGESTLDHDLIIHVRELGDRGRATDEINRRIFQLFNENGIEIAFRQVDVFVKNSEGQEAQVERNAIVTGAAAAGADASVPKPPVVP
ncbi:mechanosensitive channel MscK [Pseudomonas kuykendallii]|uniref:mechanosensitive channel MscK n=1 Tax=Pseudomonas kuykendallii TaxID=1007099 RepID=UPI0028D6C693|nr:mechanosensitive channel MscK [Pseudomonas kuykendallii]